MNEDTEILADKDNIEHKNDVIAESSTAPVRPECNVSDVCIEMSLLRFCHVNNTQHCIVTTFARYK